MTRLLPPDQQSPSAGFVIIGVVMFVLALAILGISLFSLSSYEAQFLGGTVHSHQAMYDAESGVEMVKAVLAAPPRRLDGARLVEGVNGVTYACAWQWRPGNTRDSTGAVNPDSSVTIQVVALRNGVERRVLARFRPGLRENYYKRLFTISDSLSGNVTVNLIGGAAATVRLKPVLGGGVWQNGSDSSWVANVIWPGRPPIQLGAVPLPDVATFFATHAPTDTVKRDTTSGVPIDSLLGTGTRYYQGVPFLPPGDYYRELGVLTIQVQGTAIWMLPGGMRVDNVVRIGAVGANATLVMIAPPNGVDPGDPNTGIWFDGGVSASDSLRLILVSSGRVVIEHWQDPVSLQTVTVRNMSIFAKRLLLMSPENKSLTLSYGSAMDAVIDALVAQDALPNALGGVAGGYDRIAGTWRDRWP